MMYLKAATEAGMLRPLEVAAAVHAPSIQPHQMLNNNALIGKNCNILTNESRASLGSG
jgi:hypothetical protein